MAPADRPSLASEARIFLQHFGRHDSEIALALLAENITYRVPGRSSLAGTFHGREEVAGHLARIVEVTGGTMATSKVEDVMEGERHVAALVDTHAQGGGRTFHGRHLFLFAFDADRRIEDVAVFPCDTAAVDRFFGL
jgi:ketosteroid isomerase-like protein